MTTSEPSPPPASPQMELDLSTSSVGAFPVRTSATPEPEPVWQGSVPAYGASSPVLLARYDHDTSSWKTSQHCLFEGLTGYSDSWPRSGMTRSGTAYLLPPLVRLTDAIDSGSWPTPIVPNGGRSVAHVSEWRGRSAYHNGKKVQVDLNQTVKMLLPTPTANRYGSTNNGCPGDGRTEYRTKGTPSLETMAKHNRWPEHFPTPDANNFRDGTKLRTPSPGRQPGTRHGMSLHHYAARFPTPTEGDSKASGSRNTPGSKAHAGVSLTDFVRQDGGTGRLWPTPSASLGEHAGLVTPAKAREGGTLVEAVSNRQMWPTPKGSAAGPDYAKVDRSSTGISLQTAVAMYPTPTVQDANNNGGPSQSERNSLPLNAVAGGALNPTWVEWLMGFPIGWTDLKA